MKTEKILYIVGGTIGGLLIGGTISAIMVGKFSKEE